VKVEGWRSNVEIDAAEQGGQMVALARKLRRKSPKGGRRSLRAVAAELAKAGFKEFQGMDIVVANAGIYSVGRLTVPDDATALEVLPEQRWHDMIDVNVTGVYNTVRATTPLMVEAACGGSVVLTSSGLALSSAPNVGHYVTAKTAVTGLMRTLRLAGTELRRFTTGKLPKLALVAVLATVMVLSP